MGPRVYLHNSRFTFAPVKVDPNAPPKPPKRDREAEAEREAERLGFRLDTVWEHKLPGDMGARAILVYRAPGSQGN